MKIFISTIILSAVLLFSLSACGSSSSGGSSGSSTSQKQSQPDNTNTTKSTDKSSKPNNSTNNSGNSTGSTGTSNSSSSSNSINDNSQSILDKRTNAVINATLKYESKQPNTTVNYTSKTMTQNGKKVGFTIIPTSDHQNDFKEGFIKEVINNKDESHDVTLFQYKIDNNNNLSLIDTSTEKVVYTTNF